MKQSNIIVVGAGIVGAMAALHLQRKGQAKVTLIDKWEPGHARAASTDYNRVIRAISGRDEFYTRWARESRLKWLELQAEAGEALMYECGALILATVKAFKQAGGVVKRGAVTTDATERPMLDGKPLKADVIVIATGAWMADMFPRTIKPISQIVGINVLYTSTPAGFDTFDMERMPCWIDHGQGSFGIPSSEGSGVKAAVVIPDQIDLDNEARLIKKEMINRTERYIARRLPGLTGQKVVDSKFNQIILTPDTHFVLDWHPEHDNVLFAGGCSGHLFKHAPVFGEFAAGVALHDYGTADRFKVGPRKKLSPKESPSGR
jgi:glycine/D-amino acid oxidase-like deaminating enzyme